MSCAGVEKIYIETSLRDSKNEIYFDVFCVAPLSVGDAL